MNTKINEKKDKKPIFFIIFQCFLFAILISLIISVSLNATFINKIDNFIFYLINFIRSDFINNLMLFITFFGESFVYVIIIVTLLIIFFKKRKTFYPLIFMSIFSAIISTIFKELIQRARPIGEFATNLIVNYSFPSSWSFPSGHTQTSLVFYFLLTYILLNYFYNGKHRKLYLGLAIGFSSLIMLSRLVLGVHFFTDILAGVINATILISNYLYFSKQINLVIKQ